MVSKGRFNHGQLLEVDTSSALKPKDRLLFRLNPRSRLRLSLRHMSKPKHKHHSSRSSPKLALRLRVKHKPKHNYMLKVV